MNFELTFKILYSRNCTEHPAYTYIKISKSKKNSENYMIIVTLKITLS